MDQDSGFGQQSIRNQGQRVERSHFEKPILKMSPVSGILIPVSGFMTHDGWRGCARIFARVGARVYACATTTGGGVLLSGFLWCCCMYL